MKRALDVEEILTELQQLAETTTGPATVAVLSCMDVVERHGRIADEAEIKARVPEAGPLLVQQFPEQAAPEVAELTSWPCPWCKTEDEHRETIRKYQRIVLGDKDEQ